MPPGDLLMTHLSLRPCRTLYVGAGIFFYRRRCWLMEIERKRSFYIGHRLVHQKNDLQQEKGCNGLV